MQASEQWREFIAATDFDSLAEEVDGDLSELAALVSDLL